MVKLAVMSDAIGPGDLVLCVNASPNHVTGEPVPLVAGETYMVAAIYEFMCPCRRGDAPRRGKFRPQKRSRKFEARTELARLSG